MIEPRRWGRTGWTSQRLCERTGGGQFTPHPPGHRSKSYDAVALHACNAPAQAVNQFDVATLSSFVRFATVQPPQHQYKIVDATDAKYLPSVAGALEGMPHIDVVLEPQVSAHRGTNAPLTSHDRCDVTLSACGNIMRGPMLPEATTQVNSPVY